eukprot:CAMPEP_0113955152 /NCGR_PEP_ID=MMETSP0011_2-20120614/1098_1 /TAXON_ID=101924 /ORGANISM="Rhodosorus marinus" /LENGTH=47 /DNA_ID=CAMNT_0000964657 /DNA_START=1746 /DNA_END=1889 /DNA_ORIENTATION=- /assembly_acc=CAM_ASM_000156
MTFPDSSPAIAEGSTAPGQGSSSIRREPSARNPMLNFLSPQSSTRDS